ncbi:substance-P receptor-like [Brachionus plicatilis]|uniref:Substance-P receptor-like n=1 Tax=Brachionus plicatilis TaxID=10195 RepID=A0A3M7P2I5_BRAPC|nr:substance-P receptor-like [Brachionus plicatilis]
MEQMKLLLIMSCYICFNQEYNITIKNFEANFSDYIPLCQESKEGNLKKCLERQTEQLKHKALSGELMEFTNSKATNTNGENGLENAAKWSKQLRNHSNLKINPPKNEYSNGTTIFLTMIYAITIILSVVGNVLVLLVMCCGFRSSFLDISSYLMNLSVFNLLMSIFCIPFTFINALLGKWIFNGFMCPFTNFIQLLSVNGCIFTLTFLAINRFFAVAYPLKYNSSKNRNHNRKSLTIIWMVAILLASAQLFIYKSVPIKYQKNSYSTNVSGDNGVDTYYVCSEIWDSNISTSAKYYLIYTIWIFLQTFLIPVIILIIMYSKIISILWNRNHGSDPYLQENLQNLQNEQLEHLKNKINKTIRMLLVIIVTFSLNWLPIHIFHLYLSIANYGNFKIAMAKSWMSVIFFVCHWLSMSNSFINPIIYSFMNKRFKTDLKKLFNCSRFESDKATSNYVKDCKQNDNHKWTDNELLCKIGIKDSNQQKTCSLYRYQPKKCCDNKRCQNFRGSIPVMTSGSNKLNGDLFNDKMSLRDSAALKRMKFVESKNGKNVNF